MAAVSGDDERSIARPLFESVSKRARILSAAIDAWRGVCSSSRNAGSQIQTIFAPGIFCCTKRKRR